MAETLTEVTDENFEEVVLNSDVPALVDLWAPWCGPCRFVTPILEEIAQDEHYAGKVKVCGLNVDKNPQRAGKYGITAIPTVLFFQGGQELTNRRLVGARPAAEYRGVLDELVSAQ